MLIIKMWGFASILTIYIRSLSANRKQIQPSGNMKSCYSDFFAEVYIERIELIVVYHIAKLILFEYYLSLSGKFMYVITINTTLK